MALGLRRTALPSVHVRGWSTSEPPTPRAGPTQFGHIRKVLALRLLNQLTHWRGWLDLGAFFLGPNLNVVAAKLQPDRAVAIPWVLPPVHVGGAHVAVVVGAWLGGLLVVGALLAWRRDVRE